MAPLPKTRTNIAPIFHSVSLDLFGPILCKDTCKGRTRKKIWGMIFNCTVTRAAHIDVTEDYGTSAILETIRRFTCVRGCPGKIYSDQGSQLIAAANDIAELVEHWDWVPIHEWSASRKIEWIVTPAGGQHQNGLSESLIKVTKRSLKHKIAGNVLTPLQLQTVLYECANILNTRPISIVSGSDPDCPAPITPNHLIIGRASTDVPQGPFDHEKSKSHTRRFRAIQDLVTKWWESWYQQAFPQLVPSYKWLQRHRNVRVGDVCLIRYRNDVRATYRLGRVQEVKVGSDGLVRSEGQITMKIMFES
jgi:transposase InsO family protein